MSRLGPWAPTTLEERLDRMESLADIRQLPYRYSLAVDSRDMDALVSLFVPDVRVGKTKSGREALKQWFTETLSEPHVSIHYVANHVIDFDGPNQARGVVYCRDELERPKTGKWEVGALQYWDDYERSDGEWCFRRRRFLRWYLADALDRPGHGKGVNEGPEPLHTEQLPEAFGTWEAFWKGRPLA